MTTMTTVTLLTVISHMYPAVCQALSRALPASLRAFYTTTRLTDREQRERLRGCKSPPENKQQGSGEAGF